MNSRIYFGIVAAVLFSSIFATRTLGANPTVIPQTLPADSISNREATLHGTITLNGKPARVAFQIRQAGKKRYVSRTPWQKVVRGQTNVSFSAIVTGLVADTDYEFRAIALVGVAQRRGNQLAFHSETEQPPLTPVATTGAAIDITTNSATLTGAVNPNSTTEAGVCFEWGTTTNYGNSVCGTVPGGTVNMAVELAISNLLAGTTYHSRVVATNSGGVSYGADVSFTTSLPPAATVATDPADGITSTSAILHGTVEPNSPGTIAFFQWGPTIAYGYGTTVGQQVISNSTVSALLSGIVAGTHHFRIVASNSLGFAYGQDREFTTLPDFANATTLEPEVTSTSVTLHGHVSAAGAFHAYFQWGLTESYDQSTPMTLFSPGTSNISYTLNNLRPNQSNHFRLVVVYSAGATYGGDIGFTTLLTRPVVATGRPLAVSYTNTTLWGTVDTFDAPANVYFEWGTTTNYGNTTTPTVLNTSGSAWATTQIAGLSSNTVYHYRLIASNSVGISTGNDFSFGTEGSLFYGSVLRDAIAAGGTITFSEDGIASPAPLFEITNNVTLDANGHQVTLSGGRFIVRPGVELTLIGLTIQNVGFQNPGGESVGGAIVLDNATLRATNCAFINNRTVGGPGTYHPDGGGKDAKGGAIAAVNSTVQIVGCFFSGNNVEGGYGVSRGPFHFPPDGRSLGGAIWALGGSLSISGSLFHSNTAWKGFAPFFSTSALCAGGALYVQSNAVEISSSVFYDNAAFWNGGAIYSSGLFGMTNSTFAGNWSQSEGTAVLLTNGVSSISHCTIASNSFPNPTIGASVGPALANRSGTLSIFGSILAGNAAGNSVGVITDLGHNLSSDATPVWTSGTGLNNTDPLLGPLSDNGGFTFTFPLLPGSPAIDAANPLTAPTADQRGVSRPQGPAPDIGSFERQ